LQKKNNGGRRDWPAWCNGGRHTSSSALVSKNDDVVKTGATGRRTRSKKGKGKKDLRRNKIDEEVKISEESYFELMKK
jgi:hypothetical protein